MYNKIDSFGKRLQDRRKECGYTQDTFAKALRVSTKSVMNWEQNIVYPETDYLLRIVDLLKCDLDYLFMRIDRKTHDRDFICRETGLSENAVGILLSKAKDYYNVNGVLSLLLENSLFWLVIAQIYDYYISYSEHQSAVAANRHHMDLLKNPDDLDELLNMLNTLPLTDDSIDKMRNESFSRRDKLSKVFIRMVDSIVENQYKRNSKKRN